MVFVIYFLVLISITIFIVVGDVVKPLPFVGDVYDAYVCMTYLYMTVIGVLRHIKLRYDT